MSWLGHWTPKQLREWQDQDEAITTVRQWKIDKIERPPWSEVSAGGRELKALWSQWALLEARENLVYRRYLPDNADQNDDSRVVLQLLARKSLRKATVQYLHNHKTGGHLGPKLCTISGGDFIDSRVVLQLLACKSLRKATLQYLHNHKMGGHLGPKLCTMSGGDFIGRGSVVVWPVGATVAKNVELGSPKRERAPLKLETVGLPM